MATVLQLFVGFSSNQAVRPGDCISQAKQFIQSVNAQTDFVHQFAQVNGEAVSGAQAADKLAQSAGKARILPLVISNQQYCCHTTRAYIPF